MMTAIKVLIWLGIIYCIFSGLAGLLFVLVIAIVCVYERDRATDPAHGQGRIIILSPKPQRRLLRLPSRR
jgi:hypothetical protein